MVGSELASFDDVSNRSLTNERAARPSTRWFASRGLGRVGLCLNEMDEWKAAAFGVIGSTFTTLARTLAAIEDAGLSVGAIGCASRVIGGCGVRVVDV